MADMKQEIAVRLIECNGWLASPGNDNAPIWLRDLVIATRDWVQDIREIVERRT